MGNEYKLTPYRFGPVSMCKGIKESEYMYPVMHPYTNFPPLKSCDFVNGYTYYIKNYLPDISKFPPVVSSGDYMADCKILQNEEFAQGFQAYLQLFNIPSAGIQI
jgi:hypothetical protein